MITVKVIPNQIPHTVS